MLFCKVLQRSEISLKQIWNLGLSIDNVTLSWKCIEFVWIYHISMPSFIINLSKRSCNKQTICCKRTATLGTLKNKARSFLLAPKFHFHVFVIELWETFFFCSHVETFFSLFYFWHEFTLKQEHKRRATQYIYHEL